MSRTRTHRSTMFVSALRVSVSILFQVGGVDFGPASPGFFQQ